MKYVFAALLVISVLLFVALVAMSPRTGTSGADTASFQPASFYSKKVVIDSYNPRAVSVRNVGDLEIKTSEIQVYVGGEQRQCTWVSDVTSIPPYTVRRCSFSGPECTSGETIQVVAPGNSAEVSC